MARSEMVPPTTGHPPIASVTWEEVGPDGSLGDPRAHEVALSVNELRELYRLMAVGRRLDRQAINLTRQGALGVYASSRGQEASQVAPVFALQEQDWLFASYRDSVAAFARGIDIVEVLALFQGSWHCGYAPHVRRVAPLTTPLATQVVHATGLAMAAKLKGDPVVALTYLGDGAASEGDAHEAMNMAAVFQAPCVFVVQNNQFAISVPLRLQTRASAIALRAAGYGMRGVRVDGNDVLSVHAVVAEAVARARGGQGPTLVEAMTYRIEAHTTADDATLYRSDAEVAEWEERDPLATYLRLLQAHEVVDEAFIASVDEEGETVARRMREALHGAAKGDPLEMFDHVYTSPTPQLQWQRDLLAAELAAEAELA
jgi:2-oxoisovalerate dehydrogenase E1 component alpha subunit